MSSLRAVAALVFLAVLLPEGLALLSSPKKKAAHKRHHRHHKTHKSAAPVVAAAAHEQKSQETGEAKFGHIQKELVEAWKHKSHMAKLRQTLDAEQKLLSSQQSLVESDVDDASDSAVQQQAAATKNMINDAKVLLHKSRQDALKQTRAALKEAYEIKKSSEHDIEASKLAIQKATKDKEEADKKIKNIAQVIHAATEEAKFFFNQEVPDVSEGKASSKSSSTPVKKSSPVKEEKQTVSVAEKQQPAKPQPKSAELKQQMRKMEDDLNDEEEPVKEEKQRVSVAGKQETASPQPKKVELKEQVVKKLFPVKKEETTDQLRSMASQVKATNDKKGNADKQQMQKKEVVKADKKTVSMAEQQGATSAKKGNADHSAEDETWIEEHED